MNLKFKMAVLFLLLGTSWIAYGQRVVGYMPYWSGDPNVIQYDKLTHINYAFALPNADGSIKPIAEVAKLQTIVTKAHAAGAKVLIAIGGWSDNGEILDWRFEQLASNPTSRARFVSAAMALVSTYNLDGIDMDWEYPDPGQSSNYFDLLMTDLSNQLKPQGKLLTAAVTGSYNGAGVSALALSKMDFVNIMAYDENEFQHSTFEYAVSCLNYWAGRGVAKNKLNLGVPFYGKQGGEVPYSTILARGGNPNLDVFGNIGYNGIPTIKRKSQYVKDQGYGGIMIWELSEDVTNANSLVSAIYSVLGGNVTPTNQAPTVALTSPATGATATAPATFTLTATASDADGSIARVEFYNGSTLLFTDNTAPYTYTWTGVAAGSYSITARATDNLGLSTTSAARTVTSVAPTNQAPTVTLTSPAAGATATAPATFTLTANATDADGSIERVEFYQGSTLLFTDNVAPYTYTWTGVAAGSYSITARAIDNLGLTATSAARTVSVTSVTPTNQAPTVSLTSPAAGATATAPATFTLTATAADSDGSIAKVEFYNGTTLLFTDNAAPYTYTWAGVAAGSYSITAKATDNLGLSTTSAARTITSTSSTGNQAPSVRITAPVNLGTYNSPATVAIMVEATDADGTIAKVDFYNGSTLIATDYAAPYYFVWPNVGGGTHPVTAVATDNGGLSTTSTIVNVVVYGAPTNQAPVVNLTSPTHGTSVVAPGSFNLTATASDADGSVSKVDFYNGNTLLFSDNTAPYSYSWTNVPVGNYTVTARATDNLGQVTTSSAISVVVTAATVNQAPVVSLTSPNNGTSTSAPGAFNLTATATDIDGSVSKVDFYNGNTLLFSDNTAPYSYSWTNVSVGNYTVTARATDNLGLVSTSAAVSVTVTAATVNQAPVVSLTSPNNGTSTSAPGAFTLTASASDTDGSISKVEFYNGGLLLFTDNVAPYSFSWTNVAVGVYSITAKATDNLGLTSTSAAVSVTVVSAGGACNVPTWSGSAIYVGGNIVQYNGIKYKANWWTQGDRPDFNNGVLGTGMVWTSQGACNVREGYNNSVDAEVSMQTLTLAPNPVEQSAIVTLNLSDDDQVELLVMDVTGTIINTIYKGNISKGTHTFALNSLTISPGIYHLMMKGEKGSVSKNFIKQ